MDLHNIRLTDYFYDRDEIFFWVLKMSLVFKYSRWGDLKTDLCKKIKFSWDFYSNVSVYFKTENDNVLTNKNGC